MVRPMVHSVKHYVQFSLQTIVAGGVDVLSIADAQPLDAVDTVAEVREGSSVKAVYLEIWLRAGSTTPSSGQMIVYKTEGDSGSPSATDMAALGDWDGKRNIFYTTMGLFNDQDADAIMAHKGWIKIPKSKQRMALGSSLKLAVFPPTIDLHLCGFATYKEYF